MSQAADFSGSTAAIADYVGKERPARVALLTECSMSDNIAVQYPELEFIRPCNLCPHMKRISLANIRRALEGMQHEVEIDPVTAVRARRAVERMLAVRKAEPMDILDLEGKVLIIGGGIAGLMTALKLAPEPCRAVEQGGNRRRHVEHSGTGRHCRLRRRG